MVHGAADVRARAGRRVLQHRRRHRCRRYVPRQVPQAAHPPDQGLLGEVLLPPRQRRIPDLRHRGRQGRCVHLLRPALPGRLAGARPQWCRDRVQPVGDAPGAQRVHLAHRAAGSGSRQHVLRRGDQSGGHRAARRERLLRPELLRRSRGQVRRRCRRCLQAGVDRPRPRPRQDQDWSATDGRSTAIADPTHTTNWSSGEGPTWPRRSSRTGGSSRPTGRDRPRRADHRRDRDGARRARLLQPREAATA